MPRNFPAVKEVVAAAFAHRRKTLPNSIELAGLAGREQAVNLTQHAGRRDAYAVGLGQGGVGVAHASVELGEVHMLHLDCASAGQLMVQVLTSAAERLSRPFGFFAQAVAERSGRLGKQALVKLIAVRGDVGKQVRERDVRIVAIGAVAGGA